MKKLLIIGHGRHGKDTVCEILRDYHGYSFISSSEFAAETAVMPYLERYYPALAAWYGYRAEDAFEDRHSHRSIWHDAITEYNREDRTRLSRGMLEAGYNIYCGMRCPIELEASRHLFDEVWWVDAQERKPLEDWSSMKIEYDPTYMKYINNNGSLRVLWKAVDHAVTF